MSYTYRTDKLLDAIGNSHGYVNQQNCPRQWVGFAIELETELQEATFEIERLKKSNLQLREGAEESKKLIQELNQRVKHCSDLISMLSESKARLSRYCDTTDIYRKKNERLTKKVKQLHKRAEKQKQRIKRLEEAGDAIFLLAEKHAPEYWLYTQTAFNNWRKAKEAKL